VNLFQDRECETWRNCQNGETGDLGLYCIESKCQRRRDIEESCIQWNGDETSQERMDESCYSEWCMPGDALCASMRLGQKCRDVCNEGFCMKQKETDLEGVCEDFLLEEESCEGTKMHGCNVGLFCNLESNTCLKRRTKDEECSSTEQCVKNLYCKDSKCVDKIRIGESCEPNVDECGDGSASDSLAYCNKPLSRCVYMYSLGETQECDASSQCSDLLFCIDQRCTVAPSCSDDSDCGEDFKCYCTEGSGGSGMCSYQPDQPRCGEYLIPLQEKLGSCAEQRYSKTCHDRTAGYGEARKYRCVEEGLQKVFAEEHLGTFIGYNDAPGLWTGTAAVWYSLMSIFVLLVAS